MEITRNGTRNDPMGGWKKGEVLARMSELDTADDIVLICRTGIRSARALNQLRGSGFTKLRNLVGGIHGWADDVDPSIPKY